MKRSALITMKKFNILIYRLNKLQNANMGFLLGFLQLDGEIYRHIEFQYALLVRM